MKAYIRFNVALNLINVAQINFILKTVRKDIIYYILVISFITTSKTSQNKSRFYQWVSSGFFNNFQV